MKYDKHSLCTTIQLASSNDTEKDQALKHLIKQVNPLVESYYREFVLKILNNPNYWSWIEKDTSQLLYEFESLIPSEQ